MLLGFVIVVCCDLFFPSVAVVSTGISDWGWNHFFVALSVVWTGAPWESPCLLLPQCDMTIVMRCSVADDASLLVFFCIARFGAAVSSFDRRGTRIPMLDEELAEVLTAHGSASGPYSSVGPFLD